MKSFTYGTTPEEVIREALPHRYSMELNKGDMIRLLKLLFSGSSHFNELSHDEQEEIQEWSFSFRTTILSTLDIEEI